MWQLVWILKKDSMLSVISQSQKDKYDMIPLIWGIQMINSQTWRMESEYQGLRGEKNVKLLIIEHKVLGKQSEISSRALLYNTVPMVNNTYCALKIYWGVKVIYSVHTTIK